MRLDNPGSGSGFLAPKKVNLAYAMHMDRVYPINMSFRKKSELMEAEQTTARDSTLSIYPSKHSALAGQVKELSSINL